MKNRRCLAIIPARGGSKRVKGKNLLDINGKPLLWYSIKSSEDFGKFDEIIVNSEDENILQFASQCGINIYKRPGNLANDTSKVLEVLKEQIVAMALEPDTLVCVLLPTCPLRSVEDLEKAYGLFKANAFKHPVVSVTQYEKAPEQALVVNDQGKLCPKFNKTYTSRSQDHSIAYRYNTAIIFTTAGHLLRQDDIVGKEAVPYIMPLDRSIDIDYEDHVRMVKSILKDQN